MELDPVFLSRLGLPRQGGQGLRLILDGPIPRTMCKSGLRTSPGQ
jgi:hypothetical protein